MICKSCIATDMDNVTLHTWANGFEIWCFEQGYLNNTVRKHTGHLAAAYLPLQGEADHQNKRRASLSQIEACLKQYLSFLQGDGGWQSWAFFGKFLGTC